MIFRILQVYEDRVNKRVKRLLRIYYRYNSYQ